MATMMETLSQELSSLVSAATGALRHVYAPGAAGRTAFLVSKTEAVTVAMEAEIGETVTARDAEGGEQSATVVGFDRTSGVTLLSLSGEAGEPLEESDGLPPVGALAVGIALPSVQGVEARLELLRCVGDPLRLPAGRRIASYLQTDGVSYPGFTGAPLLSADGKLLGLALPSGKGETFYLPAPELSAILAELREHRQIGVAYLGVRGKAAPLRESAGERAGKPGYLLTDVEEDSPAAAAGLTAGDFILSIDGEPIDSIDALFGALQGPVERRADILLLRGDKSVTVEVQFTGERQRRRSS